MSQAHTISPWLRVALMGLALVVAVGLAWPPSVPADPVHWEQLIEPLATGEPVVRGYVLSPPRRGEDHDVVFVAERTSQGKTHRAEVHVVDRGHWEGIRETRSFGVAYEIPRSSAPREDLEAVTEVIATSIRKNDSGFDSVDSVPMRAEPAPPRLARSLAVLADPRGLVAVGLVLVAVLLALSLRLGPVWAGAVLAVLGLALRLPHLDLPFVRDQDVQRMFTGQLPLSEILTGFGLEDRHPPLYFVLLHAVQGIGFSEAIARTPAVIAGALLGPSVIWAAWLLRERVGGIAAFCGALLALSPVLVARSREVSEIPLFALISIVLVVTTSRSTTKPTRTVLWVAGVAHALCLWTYYLAPFVIAGMWIGLWIGGRPHRSTIRAGLIGTACGVPALVIGLATLVRDHGSRQVAARFPTLAWGDHTTGGMVRALWSELTNAFGVVLLVVLIWTLAVSVLRRRDPAVVAATLAFLAAAVGIVAISPIARVQPYYLVAVLPLLLIALAVADPSEREPPRVGWATAAGVSIVILLWSSLPSAGLLYIADPDAFMPRFARTIASRPARRIAVAAHYDATLLGYYLAREVGAQVGWSSMRSDGLELPSAGRRIVTLAWSHQLDDGSALRARDRLRELRHQGALLVIDRRSFRLPGVTGDLAECEVLDTAPSAQLLRCE